MKIQRYYHPTTPDFLRQLCETRPMQRLQQVGMNCGCEYTAFRRFQRLKSYTRFDHSLGTARIVWHFTEDPVQSAAALFHDIATPTFAHSVDFMRGDHLKQEATEASTMTKLDSILKSRDISLPTKNGIVKTMVFPVVMYECESRTIKKVERLRTDAFEL